MSMITLQWYILNVFSVCSVTWWKTPLKTFLIIFSSSASENRRCVFLRRLEYCLFYSFHSVPSTFSTGDYNIFFFFFFFFFLPITLWLRQLILQGALSRTERYTFCLSRFPPTCWYTPVKIWQMGQITLNVQNISVGILLVANFWSRNCLYKYLKDSVWKYLHILCPFNFQTISLKTLQFANNTYRYNNSLSPRNKTCW